MTVTRHRARPTARLPHGSHRHRRSSHGNEGHALGLGHATRSRRFRRPASDPPARSPPASARRLLLASLALPSHATGSHSPRSIISALSLSHSMTAHDHVRASMDSRQPQPHADACATRVFEARVARTARPPTQAPLEGDEVWRRGLAFDEGAVEVGEVAHAAHGRSRPYLARARRKHRLGVPKGRPLRLRQDG